MACQDITKFGIFDLTYTSIDESIVESLRHWVKSNHFQTQSDAHQAGFGLGIKLPIDEIPVGVNADGTYGDSHSNNWSDAFESELTSNNENRTQLVQVVKKANADIVNAWVHCEGQTGFKCWAIQAGNSHDVVLKMIINRPYEPFNGARIKNIVHSDNVVVAAGQKLSDKIVVSMSPIAVLFKRVGPDADMPVTFSIATTDANYSGDCELIGLPISRVEMLEPVFDPQRTGYARLDPQTGLVTVAPGTAQGSPGNAGFKIVMEEGGKYSLVVEYATDVSRPCDVFLNVYDAQGQPVYPDYLTFVANLATAVTITGALPQPTGGFGHAYLRSTTVGELELRKGLNTIHIRRRGQGEPGYKDSGYIPDIRGIKLLRQISLKPLPQTQTAWLQLNGKETVLAENSALAT